MSRTRLPPSTFNGKFARSRSNDDSHERVPRVCVCTDTFCMYTYIPRSRVSRFFYTIHSVNRFRYIRCLLIASPSGTKKIRDGERIIRQVYTEGLSKLSVNTHLGWRTNGQKKKEKRKKGRKERSVRLALFNVSPKNTAPNGALFRINYTRRFTFTLIALSFFLYLFSSRCFVLHSPYIPSFCFSFYFTPILSPLYIHLFCVK